MANRALEYMRYGGRIPKGVKTLEKTELAVLKLLKGWDVKAIESFLDSILSEVKRRSKLP